MICQSICTKHPSIHRHPRVHPSLTHPPLHPPIQLPTHTTTQPSTHPTLQRPNQLPAHLLNHPSTRLLSNQLPIFSPTEPPEHPHVHASGQSAICRLSERPCVQPSPLPLPIHPPNLSSIPSPNHRPGRPPCRSASTTEPSSEPAARPPAPALPSCVLLRPGSHITVTSIRTCSFFIHVFTPTPGSVYTTADA